jgi:nicotinamidase-related amidase
MVGTVPLSETSFETSSRTTLRATFIAPAIVLSLLTASAAAAYAEPAQPPRPIRLTVRLQEQPPGADRASEKTDKREWIPRETAILICDTWNKHWCASATRRCDELARKMAPLIDQARARGVHIIHSPSDTLVFYRDHPARLRAMAVPAAVPPSPIGQASSLDKAREGSLPIDDSDGGCDCQPQCKQRQAWTRQHPAITIADDDIISDNGQEVYNYLVQQGIKNVIYVGVHTNMCVLGRTFGIRQMTTLGLNAVLVRDLTDTMYNPRKAPFVEHALGTDLVVKHIERHWCPSTVSAALAEGLR